MAALNLSKLTDDFYRGFENSPSMPRLSYRVKLRSTLSIFLNITRGVIFTTISNSFYIPEYLNQKICEGALEVSLIGLY